MELYHGKFIIGGDYVQMSASFTLPNVPNV